MRFTDDEDRILELHVTNWCDVDITDPVLGDMGEIGEMTGLRLRADDPGPVGVREAGVRRIDSVRTIIRRPQAA